MKCIVCATEIAQQQNSEYCRYSCEEGHNVCFYCFFDKGDFCPICNKILEFNASEDDNDINQAPSHANMLFVEKETTDNSSQSSSSSAKLSDTTIKTELIAIKNNAPLAETSVEGENDSQLALTDRPTLKDVKCPIFNCGEVTGFHKFLEHLCSKHSQLYLRNISVIETISFEIPSDDLFESTNHKCHMICSLNDVVIIESQQYLMPVLFMSQYCCVKGRNNRESGYVLFWAYALYDKMSRVSVNISVGSKQHQLKETILLPLYSMTREYKNMLTDGYVLSMNADFIRVITNNLKDKVLIEIKFVKLK